MIGNAPRFRIIGAGPTWARDHDLEPFSAPCPGCGATLHADKPFGYRTHDGRVGYGLEADKCACGYHDAETRPGWVRRPPYCSHLEDLPGGWR